MAAAETGKVSRFEVVVTGIRAASVGQVIPIEFHTRIYAAGRLPAGRESVVGGRLDLHRLRSRSFYGRSSLTSSSSIGSSPIGLPLMAAMSFGPAATAAAMAVKIASTVRP